MEARRRKQLGAYYTDSRIADAICRWAIHKPGAVVLDPSCGDGVFLEAAISRLVMVRPRPTGQVIGVDIDPTACSQACARLGPTHKPPQHRVIRADFFECGARDIGAVDVVVGNPPFVRFQSIDRISRERTLGVAALAGAELSRLASLWAPFVIHAASLLAKGGRLGMVVPAEIGYAAYAKPVLAYLLREFEDVTLVSFERRAFEDLSQDTMLLLAAGKGGNRRSFRLVDLKDADALDNVMSLDSLGSPMDAGVVESGSFRIAEYLLPDATRRLYRDLIKSPDVSRLGTHMDIGIGYVTGANDFFHLSVQESESLDIPAHYLIPAVRRGSDLEGLAVTPDRLQRLQSHGGKNLLLNIPATQRELANGVNSYVALGRRLGIDRGYKCRVREPWYSVPYVVVPDGFLTYMSGGSPRLVANEAGCVAPNTLHICRMRDRRRSIAPWAATFQNSLTMLSAELEGHSLGGGLLKLEPTEAERVACPTPLDRTSRQWAALRERLESAMKSGPDAALDLGDQEALTAGIGLSARDIERLRAGLDTLQRRRLNR